MRAKMIAICPANIHLFKVINRNTRKRCEIYPKLTKKGQNDVHVVLMSSLLTLDIGIKGKILP